MVAQIHGSGVQSFGEVGLGSVMGKLEGLSEVVVPGWVEGSIGGMDAHSIGVVLQIHGSEDEDGESDTVGGHSLGGGRVGQEIGHSVGSQSDGVEGEYLSVVGDDSLGGDVVGQVKIGHSVDCDGKGLSEVVAGSLEGGHSVLGFRVVAQGGHDDESVLSVGSDGSVVVVVSSTSFNGIMTVVVATTLGVLLLLLAFSSNTIIWLSLYPPKSLFDISWVNFQVFSPASGSCSNTPSISTSGNDHCSIM